MLVKVPLPILNEEAMDCCASPEAKNHPVKTRRSSSDIHSQKLVLFFFIVSPTSLSKHQNCSGDIIAYLNVLK